MPQTTLPDAGLPFVLNYVARAALAVDEALVLRLFVNDFEPAPGTVLASFVEATFGGYQERVIARADWAAPVLVNHTATIELANLTVSWTVSGNPQTVYGCYLKGGLSNVVYYARRFAVPRALLLGQTLRVRPRLVLSTPAVQ